MIARSSPPRRWYEEWGCKVSGVVTDPSTWWRWPSRPRAALLDLRDLNIKAYWLALHQIKHPKEKWVTDRGTGIADELGPSLTEASNLLEASKDFVFARLEGEDPPAPALELPEPSR